MPPAADTPPVAQADDATPKPEAPKRSDKGFQDTDRVRSDQEREKPSPKPSARETTEPKSPWRIPEGPLDDAKFIVISAKYIVAAMKLPEEQRKDQDVMMLALKAILKEANVTVEEYIAYAGEVAADEERTDRVGDAVIKLAEERGGVKMRGKTSASLGKLEPKGKVPRNEQEE